MATARPRCGRRFSSGLNQPFGMALVGETFYVGKTDGVMRVSLQTGQTKIEAERRKILDLPAGGYNNHWTRNVIASARRLEAVRLGRVGQQRRRARHGRGAAAANILEVNLDGSGDASVRLRAAQSGRHGLGPANRRALDRRQRARRAGRRPRAGLHDQRPGRRRSTAGRIAISARTKTRGARASGPTWSRRRSCPTCRSARTRRRWDWRSTRGRRSRRFRGGAFIGQRGSWNRSQFVGYRVAFVPFEDGQPAGPWRRF